MGKQQWKPGNMLYPIPAVMVSVAGGEDRDNIITIAWTGTVCTNPPMVYISVRKSRHSYELLKKAGDFVINLTTERLAYATDYCGVKSGRDVDKFQEMKLTKRKASLVTSPMIEESPVNIECKITSEQELGSHVMFLAQVVAVHAEEAYMDENQKFDLQKAKPLVYSHGEYFSVGKALGRFGFSVRKRQPAQTQKKMKKRRKKNK